MGSASGIALQAQPGYLLRRAHQFANAAFLAVTADHDITPVQFAALLTIRDNDGIDATRLSEIIRADRTTTGQVIGLLERKGLIRRCESAADRRAKSMRITDAGARIVEYLAALVAEVADRILAPLTPDERRALLMLLSKIDRAAG